MRVDARWRGESAPLAQNRLPEANRYHPAPFLPPEPPTQDLPGKQITTGLRICRTYSDITPGESDSMAGGRQAQGLRRPWIESQL